MAGNSPCANSMSTTGPVMAITCPLPAAATAMSIWDPPWRSERVRARGDLDHFAGDVCLANLVVGQREVADQVFGVFGGVLHGDHSRRLLARGELQDSLVDPRRHVAWE